MTKQAWPDLEKPGVPLNPDQDGRHWVNDIPTLWVVFDDEPLWIENGLFFRPTEFAGRKYGGPCLTASEQAALRAERDALKVANAQAIIVINDLNSERMEAEWQARTAWAEAEKLRDALSHVITAHGEQLHDAFAQAQTVLQNTKRPT